jgi:ribosomal protein S17
MKKVIDSSVKELVKIIESKPNSRAIAWQFILEELDAAKD